MKFGASQFEKPTPSAASLTGAGAAILLVVLVLEHVTEIATILGLKPDVVEVLGVLAGGVIAIITQFFGTKQPAPTQIVVPPAEPGAEATKLEVTVQAEQGPVTTV